ncbi:MAG: DNA polymerase/3'-5' exonuclease PolX [Candidatus Micrarchaeota archaeon]
MYNKQIAEIFNEIADMLELEGEERSFEVRAYRKAALTIGTLQEDVGDILKKEGIEGLTKLPGIGKGLADRIREFVETGKITKYEELKKKYPIDFKTLSNIQGLGPKKIYKLYKELGVKNLEDLKKAVEEHKISKLEGFGEKSESEIAKGIAMLEEAGKRMLLGTALPEAERIIAKLLASGLVSKAVIAGSTRRMRETVGDLDILVTSDKALEVMDFVTKLPEVESITVKGPTKTTVWLKIGLSCDVRVVEDKSFGAALQYFTGSKEHGIEVRKIAVKKGYKLNEYGLFDSKGRMIAGKEEREVYEKLGMQYIEPEMREARGEVNLALEHKLPKLIELSDIKGNLHTHTKFSDGANSVEEVVEEAIKHGYSYIGFSDHTKSEHVANGMDDKEFLKYFEYIDNVAKKYPQIKILKSGEVDILKDGSLDLKKETLEKMDYVIGAVHNYLNMDKESMTKRIIKALESGYIDILAHPTNRIIGERDPIQFDFDKVFEAAKANNVVMEINAFPNRLDLNDEGILKARTYGLMYEIGLDAHRLSHFDYMRYGVGTARRGWVRKEEVINTMSIEDLLKFFKKRRK